MSADQQRKSVRLLISLNDGAALRPNLLSVKRSENHGATRPLWNADNPISS